MSFASKMRASAKKLIDKYGTDMILVEVQPSIYDPTSGEAPSREILHQVRGHISRFDSSLIVGGVVNMDDLKVILYATDAIPLPTPEWELEIGGERLSVISVQDVTTTQNKVVIYTLQARV